MWINSTLVLSSFFSSSIVLLVLFLAISPFNQVANVLGDGLPGMIVVLLIRIGMVLLSTYIGILVSIRYVSKRSVLYKKESMILAVVACFSPFFLPVISSVRDMGNDALNSGLTIVILLAIFGFLTFYFNGYLNKIGK